MQKISKYFKGAPAWLRTLVFLLLFLIFLMLSGAAGAMFPPNISPIFYGVLGCLGGIVILWIFSLVYPQTWAIAGMRWHSQTIAKFLTGILIGTVIFIPLVGALILFSPLEIRFSADTFDYQAMLMLLPILPLALAEEIGFRSYPQQLLAKHYGIWVSQISIAVVFGLFHVIYGWDPVIAFSGPFVWAFLFGIAAIVSKGIAVPTGIHFALNVLQSLAGMKGKDQYSVFELAYAQGTSKAAMDVTDQLGFGLHAVLLLIFLVATYVYWKRFGGVREG